MQFSKMKFGLTLGLSLLLVQSLCAASVTTNGAQPNKTEAVRLLESGYVRIWVYLLKENYKSEMNCELARRHTWSPGIETYLDEFKAHVEDEVTDLMNDLLIESCSGFRSYMAKELSEMLED